MCLFGYSPIGFGSMAFMGIVQLLFWVFVIYLGVKLVRWMKNVHEREVDNKSIEILRDRFARGEIDLSEYEERMKVLKS